MLNLCTCRYILSANWPPALDQGEGEAPENDSRMTQENCKSRRVFSMPGAELIYRENWAIQGWGVVTMAGSSCPTGPMACLLCLDARN